MMLRRAPIRRGLGEGHLGFRSQLTIHYLLLLVEVVEQRVLMVADPQETGKMQQLQTKPQEDTGLEAPSAERVELTDRVAVRPPLVAPVVAGQSQRVLAVGQPPAWVKVDFLVGALAGSASETTLITVQPQEAGSAAAQELWYRLQAHWHLAGRVVVTPAVAAVDLEPDPEKLVEEVETFCHPALLFCRALSTLITRAMEALPLR